MSDKDKDMTETSEIKKEGVTKGEAIKETTKVDEPKASPSVSKPSTDVAVSKSPFKTLNREELQTLDYSDFKTPARMMALAEVLVKSSLVFHKKAEDVVVALMTGQELGLPFIASLSQIYPIDGKPSLGVHLQKALLIKAGVIHRKIEDAVELYYFAAKDSAGNVRKDASGNPLIIKTGVLAEQPDNSGKSLAGYRTTYELERMLKQPDGSYKTLTVRGSFSTIEAAEAELIDKTNWKRYWRRMLDARAYTIAAHEIADDILNGILTPGELGLNTYINDEGEEVVEDILHEEVT